MNPGQYGELLKTWMSCFDTLMSRYTREGKLYTPYVAHSVASLHGQKITLGRNELKGFKNLDEYDYEIVWGLMGTGLDLLEEGRANAMTLTFNVHDAMAIANRIDELSPIFEYVTYDNDAGQAANIMQVNVPLLARYMKVREAMTGPTGPDGHRYPRPASRIVPESDFMEVSPAPIIIENLKAELLSGVSTDRANEITTELLERMGDDKLDRVLDLVHQGKLNMEAKRTEYEMALSSWLGDNCEAACSALDLDGYSNLMELGADFPEVVIRHGNEINRVRVMVAVNAMQAQLDSTGAGEQDRYSRAAEASIKVDGILGNVTSSAVDNGSEFI